MTDHSDIQVDYKPREEFSPKKFIHQTRQMSAYILSRWKPIVVVAMIFGLAAVIYTYFVKVEFNAEMTFALDEGAGQNVKTNRTTLGEELGFQSPYQAGGIFSSMTNIVELMQSRLLIEKTLKKTVTIDNRKLVYADFFLDSLDYRKKWMLKSAYPHNDFLAPKTDPRQIRFENGILGSIFDVLTTKLIKIENKGKETTIISVTCTTENELFSKYFLEAWMNEVTQFYVETKTQRAKINLDFVQMRVDSVKLEYFQSLNGQAAFLDAHINPARQIGFVSRDKRQTDIQILRSMYVELEKSLETAKADLIHDTPLIQYIDTPILPLKRAAPDKIRRFLIFFFLGITLGAAYYFMKRILFLLR